MKINIELISEDMFWMLGEPNNLKAHLSQFNKGPIELDILNLTEQELNKLLLDINSKIVSSSASSSEIVSVCKKTNEQNKKDSEDKKEEERKKKALYKYQYDAKKRLERAKSILKKDLNGIIKSVEKVRSTRLLQVMIAEEEKCLSRPDVLGYLSKRQMEEFNEVTKEATKATEPISSQYLNNYEMPAGFSLTDEEETIVVPAEDFLEIINQES